MMDFVVRAATEMDGEVWLAVETRTKRSFCRDCGAQGRSKGRRTVTVRDLEAAGRPVVLVWRKRRFYCTVEECGRGWSEESEEIAPRASLTRRARVECCRAVGEDARSVSSVAKRFGVSWGTAMGAVEEHGRPQVDDPARIEATRQLGIDETAWLSATPEHSTIFATSVVDTERGKLIDIIRGRDATILRDWLGQRGSDWLGAVGVVSIDPFEVYRAGLHPHLDHAVVVADPFHIVRLANRSLDKVRRRNQQEQTGHRGRRGDPLYDVRKILLSGAERLDEKAWAKMDRALSSSDPRDEVVAAWLAKEHLREVYAVSAGRRHQAPRRRHRRDQELRDRRARHPVRDVRAWRKEILNHHRTGGASNGPTEAMNLLIKKIKRVGCGFTNFSNYRLRVLLHCGVEWNTHRAASMRGRRPPLVA